MLRFDPSKPRVVCTELTFSFYYTVSILFSQEDSMYVSREGHLVNLVRVFKKAGFRTLMHATHSYVTLLVPRSEYPRDKPFLLTTVSYLKK